jgi:hypothetical protein
VLPLNECLFLLLFISLSTQSGNFWIYLRIAHFIPDLHIKRRVVCFTLRPSNSGGISPNIHWKGRSVDPRVGLDMEGKKEIPDLTEQIETLVSDLRSTLNFL